MSKRLTLQQVSDIVFVHAYRAKLSPAAHPYFDWWVNMVATGQHKVPEHLRKPYGEGEAAESHDLYTLPREEV